MRIVAFGSGRGSNFKAIHANIKSGTLQAKIVSVISDKESAMIEYAKKEGLEHKVFSIYSTRNEHEDRILNYLKSVGFDLVILAGYMRILSSNFITAIEKPILNIHPSLLPSFPGLHAQRQALEYGVKITGCTVHLVNEIMDGGRILAQRAVEVRDNDTEETLSQRILQQEHRLYSEVIRKIVQKEIMI
ncbi:MAG: phosphoribosylglycinamide formyltransferase [Candidatus Heimdallarchaeota archaeon]|nr:phosphoribosylglycinamide formyltransferase [Candidatus Heimdallarchaeota archaeon]